MHRSYIKKAIELADKNVDEGGGPFGAVIVRDGQIIAEASNRVTLQNDPTAHAEIVAIRSAGEKLGTFDLSGCVIYASCEPCPMCLGAIYWSRISEVYYASDRKDAENAGFDDSLIYDELARPIDARKLKMVQVSDDTANILFQKWNNKTDKEPY